MPIKVNIKEYAMRKRRLSLDKLALKMGVSRPRVKAWASGISQPNYEILDLLCRTLNCKVGDLFEYIPYLNDVKIDLTKKDDK